MLTVRIAIATAMLVLCFNATAVRAEEIPRRHQYPDGRTVRFTTWSLFLVCDPTWLQAEVKSELIGLYNAYLSFIATVNDSDARLWTFPRTRGWRAEAIDPIWSRPYCESLGLDITAGPYLVITVHPPDAIRPADTKVLLAFRGRRAEDIARSLLTLEERASEEELQHTVAGSPQWWGAWERITRWSRVNLPGTTVAVQRSRR